MECHDVAYSQKSNVSDARSSNVSRPSEGVVLAVKEGTALIEGVKSVLREP